LRLEFKDRLFLLEREKKTGLGTAYIAGFKWWLKKDYKYIFEMEADFSHDRSDLIILYDACHIGQVDVAMGSRYIRVVNVINGPMSRILLSYFASKYVRFITRMKIENSTAGFVCYKRQVLETSNLDKIEFIGYAFQTEMKFKAYLK